MHTDFDIELYKVKGLVDPAFDDVPVNILDFKRHLNSDVALNKKTTLMPNGRPSVSKYYYGDDLIAQIRFEFTDQNFMMKTRREILNYVAKDGKLSPDILIKYKVYDHIDPDEGAVCIEERIKGRSKIVGSMKAFLSGAIIQSTGKNIQQVVAMITPFWDACEIDRKHFIEFGSPNWAAYLSNIDLEKTDYEYLGYIVDSEGMTVRDYMISRINY